jgi:hypothetical protein
MAFLRSQDTLRKHAIAYYLIDTIPDPMDPQRVAASRFGKAVAALTIDLSTTKSPDAVTGY